MTEADFITGNLILEAGLRDWFEACKPVKPSEYIDVLQYVIVAATEQIRACAAAEHLESLAA